MVRHAVMSLYSNTTSFVAITGTLFDTSFHNPVTLQELLVRYNPLHDQTEAERVKATARRVGLDVPVEYLPNAGKEEEVDTRSSRQRADDYKGKTGPLPPPDLDA